MRKVISTCIILFITLQLSGQSGKKIDWLGLPVVFFSPETDWGFGGLGMATFKTTSLEDSSTFASNIQLGIAYTLRDQWLFYLPYSIYTKGNKYKFVGELGYYKYIYEYYGIGDETENDDLEWYTTRFPRLRLDAYRMINPVSFVGLRYWFDQHELDDIEIDGDLILPERIGNKGGRYAGLGLLYNYDSRDNIFYPTTGWYAESQIFHNNRFLGSDFDYMTLSYDIRNYTKLKNDWILGWNAVGVFNVGHPSYYSMALLGGYRNMRGYYEGRYRDYHVMQHQGELRLPLFWRFGMVAFAGFGKVFNADFDINAERMLYSYGLGLRFLLSKSTGINLRIDAGFGKKTSGFYVTIGEAF